MNFEKMEQGLKEAYRRSAGDYRQDDEIEVNSDHHCWLWKTLADLSGSFGREISVLDVGCGTGRYFHCLKDVGKLVGLDVSEEMLDLARHPVREERISAAQIELVCENIHHASFPAESFDFIYSLGTFGYGCPLTADILKHFHGWLVPGGKLFFDVSDTLTMRPAVRLRKRLRKLLYPLLPAKAQMALDQRANGLPWFAFSKRGLERLMRTGPFPTFNLYRRSWRTPCWKDRKLECIATKSESGIASAPRIRFAAREACYSRLGIGLPQSIKATLQKQT